MAERANPRGNRQHVVPRDNTHVDSPIRNILDEYPTQLEDPLPLVLRPHRRRLIIIHRRQHLGDTAKVAPYPNTISHARITRQTVGTHDPFTEKKRYTGPRASANALSSRWLPYVVLDQISCFNDLCTSSSVKDLMTKNRAYQHHKNVSTHAQMERKGGVAHVPRLAGKVWRVKSSLGDHLVDLVFRRTGDMIRYDRWLLLRVLLMLGRHERIGRGMLHHRRCRLRRNDRRRREDSRRKRVPSLRGIRRILFHTSHRASGVRSVFTRTGICVALRVRRVRPIEIPACRRLTSYPRGRRERRVKMHPRKGMHQRIPARGIGVPPLIPPIHVPRLRPCIPIHQPMRRRHRRRPRPPRAAYSSRRTVVAPIRRRQIRPRTHRHVHLCPSVSSGSRVQTPHVAHRRRRLARTTLSFPHPHPLVRIERRRAVRVLRGALRRRPLVRR